MALGKVDDFKSKRLASGLSQSQVARALGYTKNYISMIENGKVPIPEKLADRLNEYLTRAVEKAC